MDMNVTDTGCQPWKGKQEDLRMQRTIIIIWAREMELREAEKALGNKIAWMVESPQW
jgi:hypothetical protein